MGFLLYFHEIVSPCQNYVFDFLTAALYKDILDINLQRDFFPCNRFF